MAIDTAFMEPYYASTTKACLAALASGEAANAGALLQSLLAQPGLPMHCPVHHYIVPAALLSYAAAHSGASKAALRRRLASAEERSRNVLGGFCGFYGACGAAVGLGIFVSVHTGTTPLQAEHWGLANRATGQALLAIAQHGGPRCCKRVSLATLESAAPILAALGLPPAHIQRPACTWHEGNAECLKNNCPYYPVQKLQTVQPF